MGKALYRTYRSRSLDEVVGQDHITKTLSKAIKSGRISHAYLFTGPRGVGKTSVARILAHEVNKLPYSGEETHLDIIEIDAASNRRIDEIRELRDKVNITPTAAKYKVYIIDEVHMLTREAFNALLKTLEEPPAHSIFILATTEAHKLPGTIVSRTQRFNFHSISPPLIARHLEVIAKKEKIDIDKDALKMLAEYGEGSFRDSISLMDQLASSGGKITSQTVRQHLALPSSEAVSGLLQALQKGAAADALDLLAQLKEQGTDAPTLAKFLAIEVRQTILKNPGNSKLLNLLRSLLEVPASPMPEEALEIALLENLVPTDQATLPNQAGKSKVKEITEPSAPATETKRDPPSRSAFSLDSWDEVLAGIRQQSGALFTVVKLAVPKLDKDGLTLFFEFELYKSKAAQAKQTDIIGQVIENLTGQKMQIKCRVDKNIVAKADPDDADFYHPDSPEAPAHLQTINNIFGSTEMIES